MSDMMGASIPCAGINPDFVEVILGLMSERGISRRAIELISDNRIRQAMEEGQFEDLPGYGKPIPDIDEPYDPMWWVKKWMKKEKLSAEIGQGLKTLRERKS
jgi:hypothetical protein